MNTKTVCFLSLQVFLFSCEKNQEKEIPEEIRLSFQKAYPNAGNVVCSLKEEGYEVDFKQESGAVELEYDKGGKIIEEEVIISEAALPNNIIKSLEENYPHLHIGEASIEKDKGEKVYELELLNGFFREIELEFDINGKLLRKEAFNE